ncbi:MAG: peroxide stress protein YaaA [Breznakibacter sp.]|nr:peroxide stress protein YaaA [Breznakibacter sp.]
MHIVISPSKSLDFENSCPKVSSTDLLFAEEAKKIMSVLKGFRPADLEKLMDISSSLAGLNYDRNQLWHHPFDGHSVRPAIYAFHGDVYEGLNAKTMAEGDIHYAQNHLSMLSGLYGLLRPLDAMMPYRLEMGIKLKIDTSASLYRFWGSKIADQLNHRLQLSGSEALINLASNEYFKAVDAARLSVPVITPVFKDEKNGKFQVISFYAKRARGLMSRYIITQRLTNPEQLLGFNEEGYFFDPQLSEPGMPVFVRLQKK